MTRFARGELVLDAFADPTLEVFVVITGRVDLWNDPGTATRPPDESLGPGGIFGFSALLTERSVGPRAVASTTTTVARIPGPVASAAFASKRGVRFLAERWARTGPGRATTPTYTIVDDLIEAPPLVVEPTETVAAVARLMSERPSPCAVVRLGPGDHGLVTDASLRQRVLVDGVPADAPASMVLADPPPTATLGDSAAEALLHLLEQEADFVVVTDQEEHVRGVISVRDFTLAPTTADMALHEQLRRAATPEDLVERTQRVPTLLAELLSRGLASGKVIAAYSTILDAVIRRAIELAFERHTELSVDAFTWLSLGSNGRREAVLSSDVDSAVSFAGSPSAEVIDAYRVAFGEVHDLLTAAGLTKDEHGATAARRAFARTNDEWRAAAHQWLASPAENEGAIMTSLLVDGRPIYGDPGLPAVTSVFKDLRAHPGTMRLLLQDSLARRAKLRSTRDTLMRRSGPFDIKSHALLPIVNIGRWAALSVGSSALPTVDRLRSAAGSAMLPSDHAATLVEVFEVLQRLRLRYQLMQHEAGQRPSDEMTLELMSPIDRSVIAQAVREIAATQKRMANVSSYVPAEEWALPTSS